MPAPRQTRGGQGSRPCYVAPSRAVYVGTMTNAPASHDFRPAKPNIIEMSSSATRPGVDRARPEEGRPDYFRLICVTSRTAPRAADVVRAA